MIAHSSPTQALDSARWPTVVRHVTAAALTLTAVGAVACWQLTAYAGQIQRTANSAQLTPVASSGAGDATQPAQEPPSASNAASTSRPLHLSIQPALTVAAFQAFSTDDADQPPAATAAELSVAPSDDPDAVWLDSVSGDQLLSLASAPAELPSQPPAIGQSAAGTNPVAPPTVAAIPQPVPGIIASLAVPAAPSVSSLVATPAPVPPQQSAIVSLPPVATPDKVPATLSQVPSAATAPVAQPPPTSAASVDSATLHAPPMPPKQPPPAAPVAFSAPHLDLGLLLSRGNAMLALGDISAARLLFERAAALGSAGAATALGNTYDAAFLASIQAKGIVADETAAIAWYRKAAALGDTGAVRQLNRLAPAQ